MLSALDCVVLAVLLDPSWGKRWTQGRIATLLRVAQSQVHHALRRLEASGLLHDRDPARASFHELAVHGLRYVFPPEFGANARGVAVRAPGVVGVGWVWPHEAGPDHGPSLTPLHRGVPHAALEEPGFGEIMVLVDVLRAGRARERKAAAARLEQVLGLVA